MTVLAGIIVCYYFYGEYLDICFDCIKKCLIHIAAACIATSTLFRSLLHPRQNEHEQKALLRLLLSAVLMIFDQVNCKMLDKDCCCIMINASSKMWMTFKMYYQ